MKWDKNQTPAINARQFTQAGNKKPYQTPELKGFGMVTDVTAAGSNGLPENTAQPDNGPKP